ncbi:hypothetical protein 3 [Changjiang tombus-like virus 3]|uniref:hypothetical protein 3 n=1 Tax=Changjiang tombus-like virus 3 TaxID=1922817 RepID=UPI0009094403|nr:hypothetical protein 3 [Changjiang tombus-like virus 3]APG76252.1 hypothetical protein 3 [Changjiang tombus-like virus 3]
MASSTNEQSGENRVRQGRTAQRPTRRGHRQGARGKQPRGTDTRTSQRPDNIHSPAPTKDAQQGGRNTAKVPAHSKHRRSALHRASRGGIHTPRPRQRSGGSRAVGSRHAPSQPPGGYQPSASQVERWAKIDSLLPALLDTIERHELRPSEVFQRGLRVARNAVRARRQPVQPVPSVVTPDRGGEPQLPAPPPTNPAGLPHDGEGCTTGDCNAAVLLSRGNVKPVCHAHKWDVRQLQHK